jgi:hypothetical protein
MRQNIKKGLHFLIVKIPLWIFYYSGAKVIASKRRGALLPELATLLDQMVGRCDRLC